ncbi:DUF4359 domain-containing protein [Microseira wollei]|nr:DUF4359 domain-containing protein [Microseira wollei]
MIKSLAIATLAGLGIAMAITNPSQSDYEEYAIAQLTAYLKDNTCTQTLKDGDNLIQHSCTLLVDVGRPQLQKLIAEHTNQRGFIFFSIYRTELSISPLLPAYRFETVAALQKFYTYQIRK